MTPQTQKERKKERKKEKTLSQCAAMRGMIWLAVAFDSKERDYEVSEVCRKMHIEAWKRVAV